MLGISSQLCNFSDSESLCSLDEEQSLKIISDPNAKDESQKPETSAQRFSMLLEAYTCMHQNTYVAIHICFYTHLILQFCRGTALFVIANEKLLTKLQIKVKHELS